MDLNWNISNLKIIGGILCIVNIIKQARSRFVPFQIQCFRSNIQNCIILIRSIIQCQNCVLVIILVSPRENRFNLIQNANRIITLLRRSSCRKILTQINRIVKICVILCRVVYCIIFVCHNSPLFNQD